MPRDHTLQQMGLIITKAYSLHLRNATRKMGDEPPRLPLVPPPPGFTYADIINLPVVAL